MADRKKKEEPAEEQAPFWVVAYLDLTQQFLAFFILLFSLATIDVVKLQRYLEEIKKALGQKPPPGVHPKTEANLVARIRTLYPGVDTTGTPIRPVEQGDQVMVQRVHEGLKITLEGLALFKEGSSVLEETGRGQMQALMKIVAGSSNFLEIRGFTSENPEDTVRDVGGNPSHVELSYRRALAVYDYMTSDKSTPEKVEPDRLRVTGCGKSSPLVPSTEGSPRDKNRRVEVIVSEELWKAPGTH